MINEVEFSSLIKDDVKIMFEDLLYILKLSDEEIVQYRKICLVFVVVFVVIVIVMVVVVVIIIIVVFKCDKKEEVLEEKKSDEIFKNEIFK